MLILLSPVGGWITTVSDVAESCCTPGMIIYLSGVLILSLCGIPPSGVTFLWSNPVISTVLLYANVSIVLVTIWST